MKEKLTHENENNSLEKSTAYRIKNKTFIVEQVFPKEGKELNSLMARDREIDNVIEHLYEDNVAGKLSDERFMKMTKRYEEEQSELVKLIKSLKAEIGTESDKTMTTDIFIATVRKYTRTRKLTQRMLNELIDHIEVHQAEKVEGVHVQKLTIHYNCVGSIEIPDMLPLPEPDVLIQTRKGVAVNYSPSQKAV